MSDCIYECEDCNKTNYESERRLKYPNTVQLVVKSGQVS
jgi:hypothetical protein